MIELFVCQGATLTSRFDAYRDKFPDARLRAAPGTGRPFIEYDGFQCGFGPSGQIMSEAEMIEKTKAGWPTAATTDIRSPVTLADPSKAEIEGMSGNLCRCACHPNAFDAVAEAARRS